MTSRGGKGLGVGGHHTAYRGNTDSWITPRWVVETLGEFDLDPCAATPQPWPLARHSYVEEEDGFSQPWSGRVWLNPPYGPATGKWLGKLAEHGDGVALTFARTETRMFVQQVWKKADALLFIADRLFFHYPDGTRATSNSGGPSVLIAYGKQNADVLSTCGIRGAYVFGWKA